MSNIGDMLVDVKGLKSVYDNIKSTFSTKTEVTNVDNKFSEVTSARQSGTGTTYNTLKARLDADKDELKANLEDLDERVEALEEGGSGGSGVSEDMALALLGVLDVVTVDSASSYAEAYSNFKRAWGLVYTYYSITYALSNVESTSDVTTIKEGLPYTTTLSADNQMTVSVTMGGVDVTATAYSNGVVTISEVTGNVIITASAVKDTTPKGTVDSFINTDGSVQTKAGAFATNAYEIKDGDDKIKYFASNATNGGSFSGSNKLAFYDSSGEFIAYFTTTYSNADPSTATPVSRDISSGAATFRMTLHAVDIDKSYAYINNTGRVLFAGVNTPYYGKSFITD